jgi:hypothetical protein
MQKKKKNPEKNSVHVHNTSIKKSVMEALSVVMAILSEQIFTKKY